RCPVLVNEVGLRFKSFGQVYGCRFRKSPARFSEAPCTSHPRVSHFQEGGHQGRLPIDTSLAGTTLAGFRYPLTYGSTERQYSAVFWAIQSPHHCFPAISSGES